MQKPVWDVKSEATELPVAPLYDPMVAEYLLTYGRHIPTLEAALKSYRVETVDELVQKQREKLSEFPKMQTLLEEVEFPLIPVLWQMEKNGIFLDVEALKQVGREIIEAIIKLEDELIKEIGFDINLNSAIQVGNYLAEKAGVPLSKTKTGRYATNEQELQQHAATFPIIEKLLSYRELTKLRSTYVDSLIDKVDTEGRVHTTYHQVAVNTGRVASSNPNMQNIPVTSVFGRKIKSCFVAPPGKTFVSFDYSQQELRILAHLTGEEKLIEAFRDNRDVHKTTASLLFKVDYEKVTKEQRNVAKTINFGIIYGMSAYGMSMGLTIPVEEAQEFISTFYKTYPKIKTYYDEYLKQGKTDGYVETILGRRRDTFAFPGQKFVDNNQRRVLINYPIQGSAADLMKKAMVAIQQKIISQDSSVKLLLQIHDDLVFEVDDDQRKIEPLVAAVKEIMCSVYPLSVPIEVDAKIGKKWGELEAISSK